MISQGKLYDHFGCPLFRTVHVLWYVQMSTGLRRYFETVTVNAECSDKCECVL